MFQFISIAAIVGVVGKSMKDYLGFQGRAAKWSAVIARSARKHGVSRHVLASILDKESHFRQDVIDGVTLGSSGEVGLGQFMPIAAKDIGINFSDLKSNPELQIDAAAKLLALNTARLGGDVLGAVRAYNVGIGNAKKDSASGLTYMIDVMRLAGLDWIYKGMLSG